MRSASPSQNPRSSASASARSLRAVATSTGPGQSRAIAETAAAFAASPTPSVSGAAVAQRRADALERGRLAHSGSAAESRSLHDNAFKGPEHSGPLRNDFTRRRGVGAQELAPPTAPPIISALHPPHIPHGIAQIESRTPATRSGRS